jgi:hypothetical protein
MPRDILFRYFEIRPTPMQNMATHHALALPVIATRAGLAMVNHGELIELNIPEVGA